MIQLSAVGADDEGEPQELGLGDAEAMLDEKSNTDDADNNPVTSAELRPLPVASYFIISSEFCERFSFYGEVLLCDSGTLHCREKIYRLTAHNCPVGMKTILGVFFVERLGMNERAATESLSLFVVACYLTPLLGAYLSEARYGRYGTIVRLSSVYVLGQSLLAASAAGASGGGVLVGGIAAPLSMVPTTNSRSLLVGEQSYTW